MVNDWESAFEACPPYGEGKGAYGPEDTAAFPAEMERTLEKLLPWLEAEVCLLNEYLGGLPAAMPAGAAATTFTAGASTGPGRPWRSGRRSTAGAAAHLRNGRGYDIVLARDRPEPLPADGWLIVAPRWGGRLGTKRGFGCLWGP